MPRATRILVPVVLALVLGFSVVAFLSWQVNVSADILRAELTNTRNTVPTGATPASMPSPADADSGDAALLALRRGDLLALQADWAGAEAAYQESVSDGGGVNALKKLTQAQMQRREYDQAKKNIALLKDQGLRAEDALLLDTLIALRTGDSATAASLLTDAPDSPQKHYGLALLAITKADNENAKAEIEKVRNGWDPVLRTYGDALKAAYDEFATFPKSTDAHLQTLLSRALASVQECELALPVLSRVIGQQHDYRDAWIVQGYCELTTERYDRALASLQQAYNLDPANPAIQYFLARTYSALNDHKNALTFLQYALQNGLKPEKQARVALAKEATAMGQASLAFDQYLYLAKAQDHDLDDVAALVTNAIAQKRATDAADAVRAAAAQWPDDPRSYLLVGALAKAQGSNDEAKKAFEKALSLDPNNQQAKDALKKL